jgi:DNA-binding CsgD family transcriptional regulator/predicted ester cyclase
MVLPSATFDIGLGQVRGAHAIKANCLQWYSLFPDYQCQITDVRPFANGCAYRWSGIATQQDIFMGIPPQGQQLNLKGYSLVFLTGNKINQYINIFDVFSVLGQLQINYQTEVSSLVSSHPSKKVLLDTLKNIDVQRNVSFSTREVEVLSLLTRSMTAKQISKVLSISDKTAGNHIRNAMLKLCCRNRNQLFESLHNLNVVQLLDQYFSVAFKEHKK